MSLIKCLDLSIGYGKSAVVEGINFSVEPGDSLCIVGENGSGKSTLIRTLLHLQKPLGGSILLGDGLKPSGIGYLPQQTPVQRDFPASVSEIVLSGALNSCSFIPFYSKSQKERAAIAMETLKISDLANKCYRELSGGQQQRVLLCRAICATSKLILLDEPVAGLDPESTEDMYNAVKELNSRGIASIMVSHDASGALPYFSHVLHIAGKPKFFGATEDYLKSDVGSAFLNGGRKK